MLFYHQITTVQLHIGTSVSWNLSMCVNFYLRQVNEVNGGDNAFVCVCLSVCVCVCARAQRPVMGVKCQ